MNLIMSNNSFFSKKEKAVFAVLAIVCFFVSLIATPFMFKEFQSPIIDFTSKILGRSLNASYWHDAILTRAKFTCIFGGVLGVAFVLLCKICFDENCDFKILFGPKFLVSDKKYFIAVALAFVIISGVRFYWFSYKQAFHVDEVFSIGIINRNEYGVWHGDRFFYKEKDYENNIPILGKTIKENAFFDSASILDGLKDLSHLYLYCNDPPHTGVYYMLQRLMFLGKRTCDIKMVFLRFFLLNYLIFIFSFYTMLLLLNKLSNSSILKIIILFASFMNPTSIGNAAFFRPFALQEFALILFAYIFSSFYLALKVGKPFASKKTFFQGSACLGFALVSEYFSIFFVVLLGAFIIIECLVNKRYSAIQFFISMFFVGFIVAKLFYPDFGIGFFDSRHDYSFQTILSNFSCAISATKGFVNDRFLPIPFFCFILLLDVTIFMFALKRNVQINPMTTIIVFCSVLFMFFCNYFAPYKYEIRYSAPVFVLFPLVVIPIFNIHGRIWEAFARIIQLCITLLIIHNSLPKTSNKKYIDHLYDMPSFKFNIDSSIPVVVKLPLDKAALYPYVNENQIYWFVNSLEDFDMARLNTKKFWYITSNQYVLTEEEKK